MLNSYPAVINAILAIAMTAAPHLFNKNDTQAKELAQMQIQAQKYAQYIMASAAYDEAQMEKTLEDIAQISSAPDFESQDAQKVIRELEKNFGVQLVGQN